MHETLMGAGLLLGLLILLEIATIRRNGLKIITPPDDDDGGQRITATPATSPTPDRVERNNFGRRRGDQPRSLLKVEQTATRPNELNVHGFNPRIMREELARARADGNMLPATFHYTDPAPWMFTHPLFDAIWDEIKTWEVNVPTEYNGYCEANGNHVAAILLAIMDRVNFEGFDWNRSTAQHARQERRP